MSSEKTSTSAPSATLSAELSPPPLPFHRITLLPSQRVLEVPHGTRIFDACRQAGVPLASACDGDAICARCKVEVLAGADALSPITPAEARMLSRVKAEPSVRMACETFTLGDITLTTGYW
ncbi:MAG: 2Fe-2S iron-sulfur cluster-binding protein [Myxococcota bacterium]